MNSLAIAGCEPQIKKTESMVDAPAIFPYNSSEAMGKRIFPNPKNLTNWPHSCIGTLVKTVSKFVVTQNVEKNRSGKIFTRIRTTYSQIVKNLTDHLVAVLFDIEKAYSYANFEQCLSMIDVPVTESEMNSTHPTEPATKCAPTPEPDEIKSTTSAEPKTTFTTATESEIKSTTASEPETKSAPVTEAETKFSFLVPSLLVMITVLIAYVAFLHQKLRIL